MKQIGGVALAGLLLRPGNANLPIGIVEAVRANSYPGPKKICDPSEITKPGQWAG